MNVLSMLGRGAATVGRGVGKGLNAWLDYASMGGLPMDMYYPGGAPDDVKKVMRRDYLQSLGAALGSDRPGMAQELHRSHALDYLNALQTRRINEQFMNEFGGVTTPSPEDYTRMGTRRIAMGDAEGGQKMLELGAKLRKDLAELNQLDGTSYDVQAPDGSVTKQQRTKNGQVVTLGATPENFGSPTQGVFNGQPGLAAVGNRGTVRVLPGAAPLPNATVVGQGDQKRIVDQNTGATIGPPFEVRPEPQGPPVSEREFQFFQSLSPEQKAGYLEWKRAGSQNININQPQQNFKNESDMRTEFNALGDVKAYNIIHQHAGKAREVWNDVLKRGLDKTSLNNAQQVLVTAFNRVLDEMSTVREAEYARTPEGLSLMAQVRGKLAQIVQGGAGLDKAGMEDLMRSIATIEAGAKKYYDQRASQYRRLATGYNLDPERVVLPPLESGGYTPIEGMREIPKTPEFLQQVPMAQPGRTNRMNEAIQNLLRGGRR